MAKLSNVAKLIIFALIAFTVIFGTFLWPTSHSSQPPHVDPLVVGFFTDDENKVQCPSTRLWTKQELQGHATPSNLLIVVHSFVLNVTDFLPHHPGGTAILRGSNGVDAAELFTQFHQPSTVGMFKNFCVGRAHGL
jgi:cytochrome b involved in lipid metabolism